MRQLDLISGIFWLFLSIIAAIGSYRLRLGAFHRPGSGFFPFWAAIILGLLSLIILLQALVAEKQKEKEGAWLEAKGWPKAVFLLATLLGYTVSLEKLGFIVTTFIFLCLLLKTIESRSWPKVIGFSFLTTFLSYLLFHTWLKVQLPAGLLAF